MRSGSIIIGMLAGALLLGSAPGCAAVRPEPRPARVLSPDSMEVLERALLRARPGFRTHAQALRAGAYESLEQRSPVLGRAVETAPAAGAAAPGGSWVIQVGAYDDPAQAESAATEARRRFPRLDVVVEAAPGLYRVALAGWPSAGEAEEWVGEVRRTYPDAWIRERRR